MDIRDVALPEVYKSSADFRFFIDWFSLALSKVKYDTENLLDLYDALRCPSSLLWMLGDTIGYTYDDRLPAAYNRLVLLYFMSIIKNKGSSDGVTLAAELNLAQFNILEYGKENSILYDRLEDTSIPVNSVYVSSHVDEGYIDIVYFSTDTPVDVCVEYARPLGMYAFQYSGARYDARTKLSVDARLTNTVESTAFAVADQYEELAPTPFLKSTSVGHYSRDDYARMQRGSGMYVNPVTSEIEGGLDYSDTRRNIWYRNSIKEENTTVEDPQHQTYATSSSLNPGYRALYSLQICNNDHLVRALIRNAENPDEFVELDPIFTIPVTEVTVSEAPNIIRGGLVKREWNLEYNKTYDQFVTHHVNDAYDVYVTEDRGSDTTVSPYATPAVNPMMFSIGDAISLDNVNSDYYPDTPPTEGEQT